MIQVGDNPILRLPSSTLFISQLTRPQLLSTITLQYKRHFVKNSFSYELIYKVMKQLTNGVFNKDLIGEVFMNFKNVEICVGIARKYMEEMRGFWGEEWEEEGEEQLNQQIQQEETVQLVKREQSQRMGIRVLEIQSNYQRSIKCLGDELSICSNEQSQHNFEQHPICPQLYHLSSPISLSKRQLSLNHSLDIAIFISPPQIPQLPQLPPLTLPLLPPTLPQPLSPSLKNSQLQQISTYSSNSLTKSCMLNSNKQFLITPQEVKKERIDYKKEYDRKMQGVLVKNSFGVYKSAKKK